MGPGGWAPPASVLCCVCSGALRKGQVHLQPDRRARSLLLHPRLPPAVLRVLHQEGLEPRPWPGLTTTLLHPLGALSAPVAPPDAVEPSVGPTGTDHRHETNPHCSQGLLGTSAPVTRSYFAPQKPTLQYPGTSPSAPGGWTGAPTPSLRAPKGCSVGRPEAPRHQPSLHSPSDMSPASPFPPVKFTISVRPKTPGSEDTAGAGACTDCLLNYLPSCRSSLGL